MVKQFLLALVFSFFAAVASASVVLVHEENFNAGNVIINKIGVYSDLTGMESISTIEYRQRDRNSLPMIVVAVGLSAFRVVCDAHPDKILIAILIGKEEYLSTSKACNSKSTAVFSGADLSLRLEVLKYILPNISRLGLVYSNRLNLDEAYYQEQARFHDLNFVFSPTPSDRNSIIKIMNHTVMNADVIFSIIDSELYQPQIIQDVLRLFFRQRKIMVGPSNNFVKAGALFAIYSDAEEQIKSLAGILIQLQGNPYKIISPLYPPNLKIVFNPYLVRSFGLVLPSEKYLENNFGLCPESGCAKALD